MKRLHQINFVGVLAVAILCVVQWRANRQLNLEILRLEKVRLECQAQLLDQELKVRGLESDLAHFKAQFTTIGKEFNDASQMLRVAERESHRLTLERDQLKTQVADWAAAVDSRDERLKEASEQIRILSDELNASIHRFNELATNHNAAVKALNEFHARPAQ